MEREQIEQSLNKKFEEALRRGKNERLPADPDILIHIRPTSWQSPEWPHRNWHLWRHHLPHG